MKPLPRGLYAIADAGLGDPVRFGTALFTAGCRVVQLRAKGWDATRTEAAARSLVVEAHRHGALLIVNDVPLAGADGVHLGQEDGSVAEARARLGPGALVGRSTHDIDQVLAAQDADYLGFGPVFATATKPGALAPRGLAPLCEAVRRSARPIVAIGGIGPDRIAEIRDTGVHGWAVISALHGAADLLALVRALS